MTVALGSYAAQDHVSADDLDRFIGPNAERFARVNDKIRSRSRFVWSWSWPGFLFPVPWMMYRKMYIWAGAALLIPFVLTFVLPSMVANVGFAGAMGAIGKRLYLSHAEWKIRKISAGAFSAGERARLIEEVGGVSITGAILGTIVMLAPIALLAALGMRAQ